MAERNNYIDFLRFIGITLIVLAHVNTPYYIKVLRSFDVPLMVFVSGLSYSLKDSNASWTFFWKPRFKRLIIPSYIFLTFFFVIQLIIGVDNSLKSIVESFLFLNSGRVNYLWIIRVFLLVTLVTPFLIYLNKKIHKIQYPIFISVLIIVNETIAFYSLYLDPNNLTNRFFIETVPYILGYSIIFLAGLRIRSCDGPDKHYYYLSLLFFSVLGSILYYLDGSKSLMEFKYPPRFFYVIYGIFMSSILWRIKDCFNFISNNAFVLFVGRNTIWIYFWHIMTLIIANKMSDYWYIQYFITYLGSIFLFYLQYKIIKFYKIKYKREFLKYFVG